jgi:hypothetical protein
MSFTDLIDSIGPKETEREQHGLKSANGLYAKTRLLLL